MDGKIVYDIVRLLTECDSVDELNESIRIVNHCYFILLQQLETREEIKQGLVMD